MRAVELIEQGESPGVVARILGVDVASLRRWRRQARFAGGRTSRPPAGRPARLTVQDGERLEALLLQGAEAPGWPNNLWTGPRVGKLIKEHFGVEYHPDYVGAILKRRRRWTLPRPQRQHPDGDDAAVAQGVQEQFPRILSEASSRGAHRVFVDETGFMLTPPSGAPSPRAAKRPGSASPTRTPAAG
jgi:transposase